MSPEQRAREMGVEPIHVEEDDKAGMSLAILLLIAAIALFCAPIINYAIFKAVQ